MRPERHGWRLAALALGVLLAAVVAAGRLGMEERRQPGTSPPPSHPAAAATSAPPTGAPTDAAIPTEPVPTPDPQPPVDTYPLVPGWRYVDGIPASDYGERVYRLPSLLAGEAEGWVLVGGWYRGPECARLGHAGRCPTALLSDSPGAATFPAESVELVGVLEVGSGARVLRARQVKDECRAAGECVPILEVASVVWSGDAFTASGPIEPVHLMGALRFGFPALRPEPLRDLPRCSLPWPPQTYRSTGGGPRMTLIFPTVEDRLAVEDQLRAGWPLPAADRVGGCLDEQAQVDESGDWTTFENVMVWASAEEWALVSAALSDALQGAERSVAAPRPITTWQALRGLWRWNPSLDLRFLGDGPLCTTELPPNAHLLSDPYVLLMAVFPTPAERRDFESSADPAGTFIEILTGGAECSPLNVVGEPASRWVGFRNVLLLVDGPETIDEHVRDALREVSAR